MSESALAIGGDTILRLRGDASPAALLSPPRTPGLVAPSRSLRKQALLTLALLLAVGAAGRFGWHWWTNGRFEEATDNAYLQADKVVVAPKVGGFVTEVFAGDNQPVRAGQIIARIDDRDFRVAFLQSKADLDKARASLDGVASALIQQQAKIEEAKADVTHATAALDFAIEEQKRYNDLLGRGAGTVQRSHQAISDFQQKQAVLDKAKASYDAALKQTDGLRSLEDAARASLQRSEINLEQAKLNLDYTTITAPIDGVVGDRALRKGQFVQPGTNLLTIVPMGKSRLSEIGRPATRFAQGIVTRMGRDYAGRSQTLGSFFRPRWAPASAQRRLGECRRRPANRARSAPADALRIILLIACPD